MWLGMGAWMPSLGEKDLFQEGSSSSTREPNHKGDSFSSFQGFKATYVKCHGPERGIRPPSPATALVLQGALTEFERLLSFIGNVNAVRTCKHSPLALGRRLLDMTCQGAGLGSFSTETPQ